MGASSPNSDSNTHSWTDMIYQVLNKVDASTLISASCCSSRDVRGVAAEEGLWQALCEKQWPCVQNPRVNSIICSIGGFRKFFLLCSPRICLPIRREALAHRVSAPAPAPAPAPATSPASASAPAPAPAPAPASADLRSESLSRSEWLSIVEVTHNNQPLFSTIIDGFSCLGENSLWFLSCPLRLDAIPSYRPHNLVSFSPQLSAKFLSVETLRVTWILINKKTKQLRNLSSFTASSCHQNWLHDNEFDVNFGSLLPAASSDPNIQSCIMMKLQKVSEETTLEIKSLSLYLQRVGSLPHLNGRESLVFFYEYLARWPQEASCYKVLPSQEHTFIAWLLHAFAWLLQAFAWSFVST